MHSELGYFPPSLISGLNNGGGTLNLVEDWKEFNVKRFESKKADSTVDSVECYCLSGSSVQSALLALNWQYVSDINV